MTHFIDVRMQAVGGEVATVVALNQGTNLGNYSGLLLADLLAAIRGRHVLIATHGFNVNREDGIAHLSNWESLLQFPQASAFVGLLWPGDSVWAHGLDYPDEPKVANQAGQLIGPFIDAQFGAAASVSFASHSLGARLVLETIANMKTPVRRAILMAGAIDDDCLTTEFQAAGAKIGTISVLASKKDEVLSALFPLGNVLGGILTVGHPWWHGALGRSGPSQPGPANFQPPFEIPDVWEFGHGNYLQIDLPNAPALPIPTEVPPQGSPIPAPDVDLAGNPITGWQEAFSAAFVSSRFR
jgi:hypothetical protein